jgi:septation ring formation regulator EzrA
MSVSTIATTQLERENLEAHVDLCAERYRILEEKVNNIDTRLTSIEKSVVQMREDSIREFGRLREDMIKAQNTTNKIMMGTGGTIIAGVLTVVVTLLMS